MGWDWLARLVGVAGMAVTWAVPFEDILQRPYALALVRCSQACTRGVNEYDGLRSLGFYIQDRVVGLRICDFAGD
ncbi:hypothetical protein FPV67DRAFT_34168 [Lyophyllum atratum]|nr:hypothetical protein FPV67DRAFT_34168 [Lyophyllum atratum]